MLHRSSLRKQRTAISYFGLANVRLKLLLCYEGQRFLRTSVKLKPSTSMGMRIYRQARGVSSSYRIWLLANSKIIVLLHTTNCIINAHDASALKMEQEGLGGEDEIYGEPNERETEPLLALPPEPPAAYEKFRVGRQRQQRKRWIIPAQFALKLSFWSLGMWGHRAWKYISQTFLVIAFVCIEFPIVYAAYNSQSEICSVCSTSYNYSIGTEKWRTCCYKWKYTLVANGTFFTASLLSYLVFVACYVVGKRTTSALVCPPRFLIKETDKPVIFVLFLAFLVMNVFSTIRTVINICATSKFVTISLKYAFSAVLFSLLPAWVSLNVCHTFASICIVLGRLTDTIGLLHYVNGYPRSLLFLVSIEKLHTHN